jgi:hypothetical protein
MQQNMHKTNLLKILTTFNMLILIIYGDGATLLHNPFPSILKTKTQPLHPTLLELCNKKQ